MSIPASVCPYCLSTVPTSSYDHHLSVHDPVPSNDDMAREMDGGADVGND